MRFFHILLLVLLPSVVGAQTGNYFLSNYSPNDGHKQDNVCFQMLQHENGLMYFATRTGILEFDGRTWNNIPGNGAVYTMLQKDNGELFWGGSSGYGTLRHGVTGLLEFNTLSKNATNIFQSLSLDSHLVFLSEEKVFYHATENDDPIITTANDDTGEFTGLLELHGHVYVTTSNNAIYKIENGRLMPTSFSFSLNTQVLFTAQGKTSYLAGTSNNKVYVVGKNLSARELKLEDQEYINKSVIVNGQWVNDELFVIGTLRGGMIFVNSITGKTEEIVNYSTGLPDNEIFALTKDGSNSIWAAHEYGFTRVSPYLPFRSFSHYPGLNGNLLCAINFKNKVFVGTTLGLFALEREDVYNEITYYVDAPQRGAHTPQSTKSATPTLTVEPESKKKGFFSFLKRNKTEPTSTTAAPPPVAEERTGLFRKKPQKIKRTDRILLTTSYAYRKLPGIDAKVTHMSIVGNRLIASGISGTFEISDGKAIPISEEPARFMFSTSKGLVMISTYQDEVLSLQYAKGQWNELSLLPNLKDQITYMFEGQNDDLWLCSLDKLYRISGASTETPDTKVLSLKNPSYDEFVGIPFERGILLANTEGFVKLADGSESLETMRYAENEALAQYFAGPAGIWYRDIHGWKLIGQGKGAKNLGFLNLFQNLRYLAADGNTGNLWIITGNNELYRFYGDRVIPYDNGFPIVMKSFINGGVRNGDLAKYNVDQENSSVTTEIVQPDYLAAQAIEYRYRLKGLEEQWTTWSNANNNINFPYLPAGDYTLEVQSRDILGSTKDMKLLHIEVLPPYWKRLWFYALEFVVFASLVLLSFRLSSRYRIVSRLLMLLTIIMLIQLIETIVGETFQTRTSPVIDFIIQVVIAMMVLPVEGYLREMMLRTLERKQSLRKLIWQKESEPVDESEVQ